MRELPKVELSSFESKTMEKRIPHISRYQPFERTSSLRGRDGFRTRRDDDKTSSLLTKLGISAMVCALLLTVLFSDMPLTQRITGGIQTLLQQEVTPDDALGKLKFVQNGIADVFTAPESFVMPIPDAEVTEESGSDALTLTGVAQCDVLAFDAGTVSDTGLDDQRGGYVIINHENNRVSTIFGLASVLVEKNQPLRKGDAIGRTGMDGTIELTVNQNGAAQDAMELLGLKKK